VPHAGGIKQPLPLRPAQHHLGEVDPGLLKARQQGLEARFVIDDGDEPVRGISVAAVPSRR
jgi:hypothetical protein